ncbi:hypothetical protein ACM6Q7_14085 [Peribacillus butanolivorans]|uniref:hypothetical protein n=1 Tax=Peribacillus butanolivorans TaxID=421767 RepID=UPI0039FBF841
MYKESDIQGLSTLNSSEVYFILKWGEIFQNVPLNYRTITPLSFRALLKESIEVLQLSNLGILKDYNVINILEDLTESIKLDDILFNHLERDFTHLLSQIHTFISDEKVIQDKKRDELTERINSRKEKKRKTLILLFQSLLNKMESTNILKIYAEFLNKKVSNSKYGEIDEYISLLAGELMYEEHSRQYLFEWGEENFVSNNGSFSNRLNLLEKLGNKNMKEYECIFKISVDKITSTFQLYGSGREVEFIENPHSEHNRLKSLTGLQVIDGVGRFFNHVGQLARVTVKATDKYSAIYIAKRNLNSIVKIFNLHPNFTRFDASINEHIVIHTKHTKQVNLIHDTIKPNVLVLGETVKLYDLATGPLSEESYKGLNQLLQWCRVVQESPIETSIVAMWSMLEFIFASEQKDKFGSVLKYTKPYIAHYYAKSLLNRTEQLLRRNNAKYQILKSNVTAYDPNCLNSAGNLKLDSLFEYITTNLSQVQTTYQGDTLVQRYILLIEMLTKDKSIKSSKGSKRMWLFHFIEQVEKQVVTDLQRAYRVRNILAHQALAKGDLLDDIYNKLIFYVQIILNNIIYSMQKQPYNTIHQLTELKFFTYENYRRGIDRQLSSPINFDELISNDILYLD